MGPILLMRAPAVRSLRRPAGLKRAVNINSHRSSSTTHGAQRVIIETPKEHQIDPEELRGWESSDNEQVSYKQALLNSWCGALVGVESFWGIRGRPTAVSSAGGHEVIGTFSIIRDNGTGVSETERHAAVYIPGRPPRWKPPPLGFETLDISNDLSQRQPLRFSYDDKVDKYLWKVPVRAIEAMAGTDSLADIDVMITAKRLDGFWRFCSGASTREIAANATLVKDTMFIDGFEPVGLELGPELDRPNRFAVCGNSWPEAYADSLQHFQIVRYRLGGLNLAVVAGVDTSIEWPAKEKGSLEDLAARVMAFSPEWPRSWLSWSGMSQLWLRRCPGLIACLHERGRVTNQRVQRQDAYWKQWETFQANQRCLQKLASVFHRLRALLSETAAGQPCIVKKAPAARRQLKDINWLMKRRPDNVKGDTELRVWHAKHGRYPLPMEDVQKFEASAASKARRMSEKLETQLDQPWGGKHLSTASF